MSEITTIGLDLAKSVFQVHAASKLVRVSSALVMCLSFAWILISRLSRARPLVE